MTSVTRKEGFRYGAYLFGYWIALVLFSGVLVAAGSSLIYVQVTGRWALGDPQGEALAVFGGFVAFVGVVVFGSGQFGLLYKLVSDAVETGARKRPTGGPPSGSSATEPASPTPTPTSTTDRAGQDAGTGSRAGPAPSASAGGRSEGAEAATASTGGAGRTDGPSKPAESGREKSDSTAASADGDAGERPDATARTDHAERSPSDPESGSGSRPSGASSGGRSSDDGAATSTAGDSGIDRGSRTEPTDESRDDGSTGTPDSTPDDATRESPEAVASESGIAEELGFNEGEGPDRPARDPREDERGQAGDDERADPAAERARTPRDAAGDVATETAEDPLDVESWESGEEKRSAAGSDAGDSDAESTDAPEAADATEESAAEDDADRGR